MIQFLLKIPLNIGRLLLALILLPTGVVVLLFTGTSLECFAYARELTLDALPFLPKVGRKIKKVWLKIAPKPEEEDGTRLGRG